MSDQGSTSESGNEVQFSVFKCGRCGCDKVIIMNIEGVPGTTVVCGEFKADGTGCQTQFHELQVEVIPVKKKEAPQGAANVPASNQ